MQKLLLALLFSCLTGLASAQNSGSAVYSQHQNNRHNQEADTPAAQAQIVAENTMEFEVNALMNVKADSYLAVFNVVQMGATAKEVDELMNRRISGFLAEAAKLGIPAEDVFVDMIALVPQYEYQTESKLFSKTYNEVPAGFELQKNIHILFKKSQLLDQLITQAAAQEIYELVRVEYNVNDAETVYSTLREKAIEYMNKKTASFKKAGVNLDTTYHVIAEASAVAYPKDRYSSYQAYNSTSLDAVKRRSNISQAHKPLTMFYDKIDYDRFQVVINPVVLEPVVQYTYQFKVRYTIRQAVPKVQHHYMLITPEGKLNTVEIR